MNPHWPYLPVKPEKPEDEDKEKKREAWDGIVDMPLRYHFYFRILDGDNRGRSPYVGDTNKGSSTPKVPNPEFDHRASSNLQLISNRSDKDVSV